ncbi:MAG TPA: endonuclease III domain-containing protein [Patescibacteria group bacterium]|nr:endonuclease III domain-containing protein [Patescibacteria group bacterium]
MHLRSPTPPENRAGAAGGDAAATGRRIEEFYGALDGELGPLNWWPGETRFEVIVGAILTQNTAWSNVERAIANLRREKLLDARALGRAGTGRLERLVRPSGYFRQKARKLKTFVRFLDREFGGSLDRMFRQPTAVLREKLLAVHGIGPETADSILLYAGKHPVFVIDAYTRRILARHELLDAGAGYQDAQNLFHRHLPRETALFNQYHALLVETGKRWCRPRQARCQECPLGPFLEREP